MAPQQTPIGRMTLRITDSPVAHANRVVVQFTGLEIKPRDAGHQMLKSLSSIQ